MTHVASKGAPQSPAIGHIYVSTQGVEKLLLNLNIKKANGQTKYQPEYLKNVQKKLLQYYKKYSKTHSIKERYRMPGVQPTL